MKQEIDFKLLLLAVFCLDKIIMEDENGKILWTLLKIITGGGFGIWWLGDLIMILLGKYRANPLDYFESYRNKK